MRVKDAFILEIKELAKNRDLSYKKLAESGGLSRVRVMSILKGDYNVNLDTLDRLEQAGLISIEKQIRGE